MSVTKERLQLLAGLIREQTEKSLKEQSGHNKYSDIEEMIQDLISEAMHLVDQSAEANKPGILEGAELLKDKIMLILWNES